MGTSIKSNKSNKRKPGQTARRGPTRAPYDKVLIVCEGRKTEPNYFRDLIKWHDISSVNVRISGDGGSAPTSVVQHGLDLYLAEKRKGEPFDRVYCVFDRDSYHLASQHKAYQQALASLADANAKEGGVFYAITSIPCFEYWLLLHFCYTTRQFAAKGYKSVGDMVLAELKKYWPSYEIALLSPYLWLKKNLPQGEQAALEHARRAMDAATAAADENPSTRVYQLVEYLIQIKAAKG